MNLAKSKIVLAVLLASELIFMLVCNTAAIAQTPEQANVVGEFVGRFNRGNDDIVDLFYKNENDERREEIRNIRNLLGELSDVRQTRQTGDTVYYNVMLGTAGAAEMKIVFKYHFIDYLSLKGITDEYLIHQNTNNSHAQNDTDLDKANMDERYLEIMEAIRRNDYRYILRQAGKYQSIGIKEFPRFTYEEVTNSNLREVKNFFNLDSIAGAGNEHSKIFNLLAWVHDNIRQDGSNSALCEFNAIDIYKYHKSTGKGVNCHNLAITLNEMYLAIGFKSRYVICCPKNENDRDSHVINCVYSNTLQKWIWVDPTYNAYVKDENGNLLSIAEVRERLIDDRPLVLNDDANWNNQSKQTKEWYLDNYMAKNLYWFKCTAYSCFNPESSYRNHTYISLCPLDYERSSWNENELIVHDAAYFWEH